MNKILEKLNGMSSEDILNEYGEINKLPVDIVRIAKEAGIQLGSIDFSDLEKLEPFKSKVDERGPILGAVLADGKMVQIAYDNTLRGAEPEDICLTEEQKKEKLVQRQRFTIAHEIAHCCLTMDPNHEFHVEYRTDIDSPKPGTDEYEANAFAGALLMPEKLILTVYDIFKRIGEKPTIKDLSEIFCVSKHVVIARLDYLGIAY